jgi:hypothetical protein
VPFIRTDTPGEGDRGEQVPRAGIVGLDLPELGHVLGTQDTMGVVVLLPRGQALPEVFSELVGALLTLTEAHGLLDVLQHFGSIDQDRGAQARHFAAELPARAPSRDA